MNDAFGPRKPARIADADGTMHEAPVVYALVHALDRSLTGQLVLTRPDGGSHTITFFEGAPVRVEPGAAGERIGEDLVATEHLTEAGLAAGLRETERSRKRIGELFVQLALVKPEALTHALAVQTAKRLGDLANLPPESTFSLFLSARAEPEPFAPWSPLDALLSAVRAWEDRQRLHGTLRWLADKRLQLRDEVDLEALLLTSNERAAVRLMQTEAPTLKGLYASVGKGLSSLLYTLAVTRQFDFASVKGEPMGQRKVTAAAEPAMQAPPAVKMRAPAEAPPVPPSSVAVRAVPPAPPSAPAPLAQPAQGTYARPATPKAFNPFASMDLSQVVSPHARPRDTGPPQVAPTLQPPPVRPSQPIQAPDQRRRVSVPVPAEVLTRPARVSVPPSTTSPPMAPAVTPSVAPPVATIPAPPPVARPTPSYSPPKFVDPGRPPMRITEGEVNASVMEHMSAEFHFAEEAVRQHDYVTAERILVERCNDADVADPRFEALRAWVKANLDYEQLGRSLNDLSLLLMAHPECESALYYRGMLHKRLDKEKAALRDFVTVVKMNPGHVGALSEIKLLRDGGKKR